MGTLSRLSEWYLFKRVHSTDQSGNFTALYNHVSRVILNCSLSANTTTCQVPRRRKYNIDPTSQWEGCRDGRECCDHLWKYHVPQGDVCITAFQVINKSLQFAKLECSFYYHWQKKKKWANYIVSALFCNNLKLLLLRVGLACLFWFWRMLFSIQP